MASLVPLPDTPRVFCTMGHGCDYFKEENHHSVPRGCTFITLEECGIASKDYPRIINAFQDPLLKDALRYPENRQIRQVLSEYYGVSGSSVMRVHEQNTYYTDPLIDLWLPSEDFIYKSGTYELGRVPTQMISLLKTPYEKGLGDRLEPDHLSQARLEYIYNGSLFPSAKFAKNYRGNIRIRYSKLMTRLGPGIYYFVVCRTPCELPTYNPKWNHNHPNVRNTQFARNHKNIHRIGQLKRAWSKAIVDEKGAEHSNQRGQNENKIEAKFGKWPYSSIFTDWSRDVNFNSYKRNNWYRTIYEVLLEKFRNTKWQAKVETLLLETAPKFPYVYMPGPEVMSQEHDRIALEQERIEQQQAMRDKYGDNANQVEQLPSGGSRSTRKTYRKKVNRRTRKRSMRKRSARKI